MADVNLSGIIKEAVQASLTQAAANPNNDLKQKDVSVVTASVTDKVTPRVEAEANLVIQNMTNEEPLSKSRFFITFAGILLVSVGGYFGVVFTAEDQAAFTDNLSSMFQAGTAAVTAGGALYGMWARWRAGRLKPLGQ